MQKKIWASNAIGLGVWETAALVTARVPTISATVRAAKRRSPALTHLLVVGWCLGLSHYLLRQP